MRKFGNCLSGQGLPSPLHGAVGDREGRPYDYRSCLSKFIRVFRMDASFEQFHTLNYASTERPTD